MSFATDLTALKTAISGFATRITTKFNSYVLTSLIGAANGIAPLDSNKLIPSIYLPSYVDDVLEFTNYAAFPAIGESGKIYLSLNPDATNKYNQYRWSGSTYAPVIASPGTTDNVIEGTTNLYFTTARAAAAAPVKSVAGLIGTPTSAQLKTALALVVGDVSGAQPSLGFTPLQQGGGTGQAGNKVYIGWSGGSNLLLQVDTTNFGANWPINISGTAASAAALSTANNYQMNSLGVGTAPSGVAGEIKATGNVSGVSDEKLKTNWRSLPEDFIEQLAQVKHGIYDRIDLGTEQVGVSAQSLRTVLEQAVVEGRLNGEELLAVVYGNAALVSAIQLAKRVVKLENELAQLKAKVYS